MHFLKHPLILAGSVALLIAPFASWGATASVPSTLTRADASKFLLESRGFHETAITNDRRIADVPDTHPCRQSLLWANRFGILDTDEYGKLHPDDTVTRGGFLRMLAATFGLTTHGTYFYEDVTHASWVAPYAGIAFHYGLFPDSIDTLNPSAPISRAEAMSAVQNVLKQRDEQRTSFLALVSAEETRYGVNIYQKISTEQANVVQLDASLLPSTDGATSAGHPDAAAAKLDIILLVNEERLKRGLSPVHPDALLAQSAQKYAEEMLSKGFFGHVSPTGETLRDRMTASGFYDPNLDPECHCVKRFVVGENIAQGQKSAREVMRDWMQSPSHQAVILDPQYTTIGVGEAAGIWVEHFAGVRRNDEGW